PAYCAVSLAGLGDLPDTILSRSIVVRMRRRAPGEVVEAYRRRVHGPAGHKLRDSLANWADTIQERVTNAWPAMPDGINDRDADIWEPLLAIADVAGGQWPELSRVAAVTLVTQGRQSTPSLGIRLLSDLRSVFGTASVLPTTTILKALHELDESPWAELSGKPLNDRGLATRLRRYDIKPKVVRIGEQTHRGYAREDLHDAWTRYLGSPPYGNETCVTDVTSVAQKTSHDFKQTSSTERQESPDQQAKSRQMAEN